MAEKLCIILQSDYTTNPKALATTWQAEVVADTATVTQALTGHKQIIIKIPTEAKPRAVMALVERALQDITQPYSSCHIVLNTHGAAGSSDLTDAAVKTVLLDVSKHLIPVSQLSALQCNGMSALSSAEQRAADPMRATHAVTRGKESSIGILHKKLNSMKTAIPQDFKIIGFSQAYDPVLDKALVNAVLNGTSTNCMEVKTTTPELYEAYLEDLLGSIAIIQSATSSENRTGAAYNSAGNILGEALDEMKKDLKASFQDHINIEPKNKPLFEALTIYAKTLEKPLDASSLDYVFRQWSKKNKLYSEARLDVFIQYHSILSAAQEQNSPTRELSLEQTPKGAAKIGIFAPSKEDTQAQAQTPSKEPGFP